MHRLLLNVYVPTIIFVGSGLMTEAGLLHNDISLQTYRDFAENRGRFASDQTNIPIYTKDGELIGTVSRMMNFDSVVDGEGFAGLVDPQFIASAAHVGYTDNMSFSRRFIGNSEDKQVYGRIRKLDHNTYGDGNSDFQIARLNKIVTDATAVPMMTEFTDLVDAIKNGLIVRIGAGSTAIATGSGTINVGYGTLTAGTIKPVSWTNHVNKDNPAANWWQIQITLKEQLDPNNPLTIGTLGGDSGSPVYAWNARTERWEYVAANSAGGGPTDYGKNSYLKCAPGWATDEMAAYRDPVINTTGGSVDLLWHVTDQAGAGLLTQGSQTWDYHGLAQGVVGWDLNGNQAATDAQMDATRDLVFSALANPEEGRNIILQGSIDMGAGSLTFKAGNYILSSAQDSFTLNSAGFIIEKGAIVETRLTGKAGDEWRKIGDGALVITGTGNNNANLNLGGTGTVLLNREGGYAANDILLNGGQVLVVQMGENQVGGDVRFGFRGGIYDMNGHSLSWDTIHHVDNGAYLVNYGDNSLTTFTFSGTGKQLYQGGFGDGGTLARGLLKVVYAPGAAGSEWTLTGQSSNKGGYEVNGGNLIVRGTHTTHAGGYVDADDWTYAGLDTGTVTVNNGASFTVADHALVKANVVVNEGTFRMTEGVFHAGSESIDGQFRQVIAEEFHGLKGNVTLIGSKSNFVAAISGRTDSVASYGGNISGTGNFTKEGDGDLLLTGTNTFSGVKALDNGRLIAGTASLGDVSSNRWKISRQGTLVVDKADLALALTYVDSASSGVIALNINQQSQVSFDGHRNLYLGAVGVRDYGTFGTSEALSAVDHRWLLGGGAGTLNVHFRLTGDNVLYVGNGVGSGVVHLSNISNDFTGDTIVSKGYSLTYSDVRALGGTSFLVEYSSAFNLGTYRAEAFSRVKTSSSGILLIDGADGNSYDFSNKGTAALGTAGTANYSGILTAGATGYRFSGMGVLNVGSALSGARDIIVDAQGNSGGTVILSGQNTATGALIVQGNRESGGSGDIILKAGRADVFTSAGRVELGKGGTLDMAGKNNTLHNVNGAAGSFLVNTGTEAVSVSLDNQQDTVVLSQIRGEGMNLIKEGSAGLTLGGNNDFQGTVAIREGVLTLSHNNALGVAGNSISVAQGGTLSLNGSAIAQKIHLAGTGSTSSGVALINNGDKAASVGGLFLDGDASIKTATTVGRISLGTVELNRNILTLTGGRVNNTGGFQNGMVIAQNTQIYGVAGKNAMLQLTEGSVLFMRDTNTTALPAGDMLSIYLNNGMIANGYSDDNGGGGGARLGNAIVVMDGGGTLTGAGGFSKKLALTGNITGSGQLTISGGNGVILSGNISGYTGNIVMQSTLSLEGMNATGWGTDKRMINLGVKNLENAAFAMDVSRFTGTGNLHNVSKAIFTENATGGFGFTGTTGIEVQGGLVRLTKQSSSTGAVLVSGGVLELTAGADNTANNKIGQGNLTISSGAMVKTLGNYGIDSRKDASNVRVLTMQDGMLDLAGLEYLRRIDMPGSSITGAGGLGVAADGLTLRSLASGRSSLIASRIDMASGNVSMDVAQGTVASGIDMHVSGNLVNGASRNLVKTGTGTLYLTGNNTQSSTSVSGGTLKVNSVNALGTGATSVGSLATLEFVKGDSLVNLISGQSIVNEGTVAVCSGVTYQIDGRTESSTGAFVIDGGTLQGNNGEAYALGDLSLTNGGTLYADLLHSSRTTPQWNIEGSFSFDANSKFIFHFGDVPIVAGDYTFLSAGNIQGDLSGLNFDHLREFYRNEIHLVLGSDQKSLIAQVSEAQAANLVWNNLSNTGTWSLKAEDRNWHNAGTNAQDRFFVGDMVTFNDVALSSQDIRLDGTLSPAQITVANNTTAYTFSGEGSIGSASKLIKTGHGTLSILTGNSFTGGSSIEGGTVLLGRHNSLGSGMIAMHGGTTLAASAAGTDLILGNEFSLHGGEITLGRSDSQASIRLDGALGLNGSATTLKTLQNTTHTGTMVSGGTLVKTGSGMLTLSGSDYSLLSGITVSQGTLGINTMSAFAGIHIGSGNTVAINRGRNLSNISGSGTILVDWGGESSVLTNESVNPGFNGNIVLKSGQVQTSQSGLWSNASGIAVNNGAQLYLKDCVWTRNIALSGAGWAAGGADLYKGASLRLEGSSFNGNIQLGSHTVIASTGGANTIAGNIAGGFNLEKMGSGLLTLSGNNTYTGSTVIREGALAVHIGQGERKQFTSAASGAGKFVKSGQGTLIVGTAFTNTGGVDVTEGILEVGPGGSSGKIRGVLTIAENAQVTLKGGDSLGYSGNANCVTTMNLNGGKLYLADAGNQTFKYLTLNLTGGQIDGVANSLFDVWDGTSINSKASDESSVISGVLFKLRSSSVTSFNVENGGADDDLLIRSNIVNSSGSSSPSASIKKTGDGTMTLTGANTYTGSTTIDGGTLRIGNGGITGSLGKGDVINNSVLELNRSNAYALTNKITGKGRLDIAKGSGTVSVKAANTYAGGTNINGGTLQLERASALGSGAVHVNNTGIMNLGLNSATSCALNNDVFVNNGGRLTGTGSFNTLTVASGGIFAPGNSLGIQESAHGVTFQAGSIFEWELQGNNPSLAGVDFDLLRVLEGNLKVNDNAIFQILTWDIDFSSDFWLQNHTFACIELGDNATMTGNFSLDTSKAGGFSGFGSWGLTKQAGDKTLAVTWTAGALVPESAIPESSIPDSTLPQGLVPEPSSVGLGLMGLMGLLIRRRRPGSGQ